MDLANLLVFEKKKRYHKTTGYFAHLQYGFKSLDYEITNKFDLTIGKRFRPMLNLGAGFSFSQSDALLTQNDWAFNTFLTPYIFGRKYLNNSWLRMYIDSKAGYSFSTRRRNHTGGVYAEPGFGFLVATKGAMKWDIGVSYYIQPTSGRWSQMGPFNRPAEVNYDLTYSRVLFKIGIEI